MICLNSVMELMTRANTMFLQVGASTPVVRSWDVVRMTGRGALQVLEVGQVVLADVTLIGRHAGDVIGVLPDQVAVLVDQRPAHLVGVLLIDAEDDCLGRSGRSS